MEIVNRRGAFVLAEIDKRLAELLEKEIGVENDKIQIGILIQECRENKYWKESFPSFDAWLKPKQDLYDRGRTQLLNYAKVVRDLLPAVGQEKLNNMGMRKAELLCIAKKASGSLPSMEIMDMAADDAVKIKDFKKVLLEAKKLPPDAPEGGRYRALEYFATADQQKTIEDALVSAKRTEPVDPETLAEEVRMGNTLEKLAMEYLSSNAQQL